MEKSELNFGEQPIKAIIDEASITTHDLVEASTEMITHKMVTKACKGRRLGPNVQNKVLNALNKKTNGEYTLKDTFNYGPHMRKK